MNEGTPIGAEEEKMEEKRSLSGKEKFAYGIGAVGKDMVYMLSASYILYYYQF